MNAHNLLMPFHRKSLSPSLQTTALLSGLLLLDSDYITAELYIMCQVSCIFRQQRFAFVSSVPLLYCLSGVFVKTLSLQTPCFLPHLTAILVLAVLFTSELHLCCKFDSNNSLGSLGNQVLRDQERSISHFSRETKRWLDKGEVGGRED